MLLTARQMSYVHMEQFFGDLCDVLNTNTLFFTLACCTSSIPTCFFVNVHIVSAIENLHWPHFWKLSLSVSQYISLRNLAIQESTFHLSGPLISSLSPLVIRGQNVDNPCRQMCHVGQQKASPSQVTAGSPCFERDQNGIIVVLLKCLNFLSPCFLVCS